MKPFIYDPLHTNPQDVARRDYLEHFVEAVLDHRGNPALKSTMEFEIKWLNHDDSWNTWEPYSNLRDVNVLHDYLSRHNLAELIPKKFSSAKAT